MHGVKQADWLYTRSGSEEDVAALRKKCMANPKTFKVGKRRINCVSLLFKVFN